MGIGRLAGLVRPVLIAVLGACLLWAWAAPAAAHVELAESEPADGERLTRPPDEVYLRFDGEVVEGSVRIRVRSPGGEQVAAGQTESGGRGAAVSLPELTEEGRYRVRFTGTAGDGHELQGRLTFRLSLPADQAEQETEGGLEAVAPSPTEAAPIQTDEPVLPPDLPAADEPEGPVRWWPAALAAGLGLALLAAYLVRRR